MLDSAVLINYNCSDPVVVFKSMDVPFKGVYLGEVCVRLKLVSSEISTLGINTHQPPPLYDRMYLQLQDCPPCKPIKYQYFIYLK